MLAPAEAVEEVELRRGEREPAVLVLAEEGDQPPAERLQVGRRGRAALHEGARAPVGAHPARQDDLVGVVPHALAQLGQAGAVEQPGRQREDALDVGLAAPGRTIPARALAAEQQVERVGEHGLARAGLAGDER